MSRCKCCGEPLNWLKKRKKDGKEEDLCIPCIIGSIEYYKFTEDHVYMSPELELESLNMEPIYSHLDEIR